jgi:hypothetical protein
VSNDVDGLDAAMPADGFEIVDIVMDAACEPGAIGDGFRAAAIPQVEKNDGPVAGQALEIFDHVKSVGDDHGSRAGSQLVKEQADAVRRSDKSLVRTHECSFSKATK